MSGQGGPSNGGVRPVRPRGFPTEDPLQGLFPVGEDPLDVATDEAVREQPEPRHEFDVVDHPRPAAGGGLEAMFVMPPDYGPLTWRSMKRTPGSHTSMTVFHGIGNPRSTIA